MNRLVGNERSWVVQSLAEAKAKLDLGILSYAIEPGLRRPEASTLFLDALVFFRGRNGFENRLLLEAKPPDTPLFDPKALENAKEKVNQLGMTYFCMTNMMESALININEDNTHSVLFQATNKNHYSRAMLRSGEGIDHSTESLFLCIKKARELILNGIIRNPPLSQESLLINLVQHIHHIEESFSLQWENQTQKDRCLGDIKAREVIGTPNIGSNASDQLISFASVNLATQVYQLHRSGVSVGENFTNVGNFVEHMRSSLLECGLVATAEPFDGESLFYSFNSTPLLALDAYLSSLDIPALEPKDSQELLKELASETFRKTFGQYATHRHLSALMAMMGNPSSKSQVLNLCSGTGTIALDLAHQKKAQGLSNEEIYQKVWAVDIDPLAFCASRLAFTDDRSPTGIRVHLSKSDALSILPGKPLMGVGFCSEVPTFDSVVANLPFVGNNTFSKSNGRQDLCAELALHAKSLVSNDGSACFLLPNSFLGTDWGSTFREEFLKHFQVHSIVTSGAGKWSMETDAVPTLVFALRKEDGHDRRLPINFFSTLLDIEDWGKTFDGDPAWKIMADHFIAGVPHPKLLTHHAVSLETINQSPPHRGNWSSCFSCPPGQPWDGVVCLAKNHMNIFRGDRFGDDTTFLPNLEDCIPPIEPQYLLPAVKSSKNLTRMTENPDSHLFVCNLDEDNLSKLGHFGALSHIKKRANSPNKQNIPLSQRLQKKDKRPWYSIRPGKKAELVMPLNVYERFAFWRIYGSSYVNQRLIGFQISEPESIDIIHALTNSFLQGLLVEQCGFPRGQGVLDLNATHIKENLLMLDPGLLSEKDKARILSDFSPLKNGPALSINQQMKDPGYQKLNRTILEAYGIGQHYSYIEQTFQKMLLLRQPTLQFNNNSNNSHPLPHPAKVVKP